MQKYPSCPRPECGSSSTRPSRRQDIKEKAWYRMRHLHMYRCEVCRHRFPGRDIVSTRRRPRQKMLPYLLIALFAIPLSLALVFENRTSIASAGRMLSLDGRTVRERLHTFSSERAERRKREIALRAKELIIWAIAEHRRKTHGAVIANKIRRDEPVYQLILETFEDNKVPKLLVEESLDDWTKGTNVQEIGRQWQEKGVDVRALVRQAEGEGLPVRKLMTEKDKQ